MSLKRKKTVGLRIVLGIAAIGVGLLVQVGGAIFDKMIGFPLFLLAGFVVMGYLVYK